jgi:lipoprotein NlpI
MRSVFITALVFFMSGPCVVRAGGWDPQPSDYISAAFFYAARFCTEERDLPSCDDLVAQKKDLPSLVAAAYGMRAQTRIVLGDFAGAQTDIAKVRASAPQKAWAESLQSSLTQAAANPLHALLAACDIEADPAKRIADCTELIDKPTAFPGHPFDAYFARSKAYLAAGEFAAARSDIDRAVQGDPQDLRYVTQDIVVAFGSGDYQGAYAKTQQIRAKQPKAPADLIMLQAQLAYLLGYHAVAIDDFFAAKHGFSFLGISGVPPIYWATILRSEDHEDTSTGLLIITDQIDPRDYVVKIAQYLLGKISPQALVAAADVGPKQSRSRRLCAGYFIIGHQSWLTGDKAAARVAFQNAIQTNEYDMAEYHASKMLLAKIGS